MFQRLPSWRDDAACKGWPIESFFPERYGQNIVTDEVKALCRSCPVQPDCLAEALDNPRYTGYWGGASKHQRDWMRRDRVTVVFEDPPEPTRPGYRYGHRQRQYDELRQHPGQWAKVDSDLTKTAATMLAQYFRKRFKSCEARSSRGTVWARYVGDDYHKRITASNAQ